MIRVASSRYEADDHLQRDGSRTVKELHTLTDGNVIQCLYKATESTDMDALLSARAIAIDADFERAEAALERDRERQRNG